MQRKNKKRIIIQMNIQLFRSKEHIEKFRYNTKRNRIQNVLQGQDNLYECS